MALKDDIVTYLTQAASDVDAILARLTDLKTTYEAALQNQVVTKTVFVKDGSTDKAEEDVAAATTRLTTIKTDIDSG